MPLDISRCFCGYDPARLLRVRRAMQPINRYAREINASEDGFFAFDFWNV
jgi:hypothetical protein